MKIALFSDTIFLKKDKDYFGMTITYDFIKKRYLSMFNEIVVSTRYKVFGDEKSNHEGYRIVNGENVIVNPIKTYHTIVDSILKRKEIIKEITEIINSVDKVIVRLPGVIGFFACYICERIKKPYIVELLACPLDGYRNHTNKIGKIIAPFMYYQTKKCVKHSPKVLYVTNSFLQKRYPTLGDSIACSDVVLKDIDKEIFEKRIKKIDNLNLKEIKLCTTANVEMRYKGHEYVIKALSKLKNEKVNYKYYLIGNGNKERLERIAKRKKVSENIVFLGSLPHEEVFNVLDEIDIYIQPSLQEGLPRAVLEAMSRACPTIASNVGGNPELLDEEFIFRKKSVKELVNIIKKMNKDKMKKSVKDNYDKIQDFSLEKLDKIRKVFYLS